LVGLATKDKVDAKIYPRVWTCIMTDGSAKRSIEISLIVGYDGVVERLLNEIIWSSSAIIKYEIIEIIAILRPVVDKKCIVYGLLLLLREIQLLPICDATYAAIYLVEIVVCLYTQLVVGFATYKFDVEIIGHEIEYTIVEYQI
jgi:hypothetical protein